PPSGSTSLRCSCTATSAFSRTTCGGSTSGSARPSASSGTPASRWTSTTDPTSSAWPCRPPTSSSPSTCPHEERPMNDYIAIQDLITRLLFAVDALDWAGVRAAFADEVEVDYTSLFGGSPERLPADELVTRWQGMLPGFAATQHQTGPIV